MNELWCWQFGVGLVVGAISALVGAMSAMKEVLRKLRQ